VNFPQGSKTEALVIGHQAASKYCIRESARTVGPEIHGTRSSLLLL
jgi:hypothetical protein